MQTIETDVETADQLRSCVNLQLAGAAINQTGMLSIKQLYSNIKRYTDNDLTFTEFLGILEGMRENFNIRDGQIGVDVNYISIKKR